MIAGAEVNIPQGYMVGGQRKCGKSYYLIEKSAETQIPILTFNYGASRLLENEAHKLGLKIPKPLYVDQWTRNNGGGYGAISVLVDEIGLVLENLLNIRINESTTSACFKPLPSAWDGSYGVDAPTVEAEDNKKDISDLIRFYPPGLQKNSLNDFRVKCGLPVIEKVVTGLEALDYLSQGKILVDKESGTKYIPVKHADVILEVNKNEKKIVDKIEIKREYLVQS